MNIKYENVSLGFIGDIHGDFQKLQQLVKPFTNTVFIVCGDCGFGFPDTLHDKIKKMVNSSFKVFLKKRNIYLLFVRGNHDNPNWFEDYNVPFSDRFILLPDRTQITVNTTNILCIGGAVSVDRRFRKVNTSYWYGEEMLDFEEYGNKPDILVTHTINRNYISHLLPSMPDWLKISYQVDKKLKLDCNRENDICIQLLEYYKPKYWIHGHYHVSGKITIGNTKIISLNSNELYEYR